MFGHKREMEIQTESLLREHGGSEIDSTLNELVEATLRMEHELELAIKLKDL